MTRVVWNKGRKWPEATKKRISEARKGIPAWNKGIAWSAEIIEKIRASKKGSTAWNKGLNWPESVRKKISRTKLATTLDLKPFHERNAPSGRLRISVLIRDKSKCKICGKSAGETVLEVDHIIPIAEGGKTILDNLQTLCITCNRAKADSLLS